MGMPALRSWAFAAGLWLSLAVAAAGQPRPTPLIPVEPLRPLEIDFKLNQAALAAEQMGQRPPTTTRFDAIWPGSPEEHRRLGGYGLLLITTVSRAPARFPTRTVVIRSKGGEFRLRNLASRTSPTAFASRIARVLGPHREEALYLAPVTLMSTEGELVQLFADGSEGVPWKLPATPPSYRLSDAMLAAPDPDAVEALLRRSLVGFSFGPWVLTPLRTAPPVGTGDGVPPAGATDSAKAKGTP